MPLTILPGVFTSEGSGFHYTLQSEENLLAPLVDDMAQEETQTTGFVDARVGAVVGSSTSPLDYELADAQTSASLGSFLSRPVRISVFTWTQAMTPGVVTTVNPWAAFMNANAIINKLQNFAFIRGNLKVKIVTNGSPFMYGSMRAVYTPLHNFKSSTVANTWADGIGIPMSQKPGVWITPAHSEGAELTLPFLWPRSFLRVGKLSDASDMGKLELTAYTPLLSANGSTGGVGVQVFAWMEDITLAGPTMASALQADEYGVGAVSAPASALASVSRKFEDVPVIGKFAKATTIGAKATSEIASLFGFTNVPVIEDTRPVRPSPFPSMASAHIGYPTDKLALDPKNELSVDPAIAGLDSTDELAVANFVTRESYLTMSTWSSSSSVDTPLFTSQVQPQLGYVSGSLMQFTPMGLASTLFKNWRGDIKFRFRFISSPFHKGRVRISYDPYSSTVQTTSDTGPYVVNRIVDLGAETDVEFVVPYQQALPWCYSSTIPDNTYWSTSIAPTVPLSDTFTNGMISVKIMTPLSCPTTTGSVYMQVFVSGCPNLQFANPSTGNFDLSPFAMQSLDYSESDGAVEMKLGSVSEEQRHRALVNFGETITSFRTLLRRHNLLDTVVIPPSPAGTSGVFRISQTRFPIHYGFDPSGWNTAKGIQVTTSNFPFNFASTTPWHLLSNCFVGQRGSMIWTYNPSRGSSPILSRISRYNYAFNTTSSGFFSGTNTNVNVVEANFWKNGTSTGAGTSVTHTMTSNGHSVLAPSYSPFKFQSTDPQFASSPAAAGTSGYDGTVYDSLNVEYPYYTSGFINDNGIVERYFCIGTDYTLHFFLCCPTLRYVPASQVVPV